MNLKKIALNWVTEPMEAWDELTETWVPAAFMGRIDLTDRFLSNFNKPTRRRMMFTDDKTVMPASNTVRHPGTLDVYILGTPRKDAIAGKPYLALTICHLATDVPNGSAGYATIYRRVAHGPVEDPGWLVEEVFAKAYLDMEFRTSANEPDANDLKIENYYAFLPLHVQAKEFDFIELHGTRYRVVDTFVDSGMFGLRIDHEDDFRSDFILHVETKRTYDKTKNEYIDGTIKSYNVTGVMKNSQDFALWKTDAEKYMDVYFETEHLPNLPFNASSMLMSLEIAGVKRKVESAQTQAGKRQYEFRCK